MEQLLVKHEVLQLRPEGYIYASGSRGPYYLDLRRCCTDYKLFTTILEEYQKIAPEGPYIGVPAAGVIFAAGLAVKNNSLFILSEKANPESLHCVDLSRIESPLNNPQDCAFLGLEDMGIAYATVLALYHKRPMAIVRRFAKKHGTGRRIEADLDRFREYGIKTLYLVNDSLNPLSEDQLTELTADITDFRIEFLNLDKLESKKIPVGLKPTIVEDLWSTGNSSLKTYSAVSPQFKESRIVALIDREQGAIENFNQHNCTLATAAYKVTDILDTLFETNMVSQDVYNSVISYANSYQSAFTRELKLKHHGLVCVGLDLDSGRFPLDSVLPGAPYPNNPSGVQRYAFDLLDQLVEISVIRAVKPNLAYYATPELMVVLDNIRKRAQSLGFLVILDAKIGDISRTQSQYARHYEQFDAITCHGYMGQDSIHPLLAVNLGVYALTLTSNPSRQDLETVLTLPDRDPVYMKMVKLITQFQHCGSLGAVVGGTGELEELKTIVEYFASTLDYLPPLLIPGVGTQGGQADEVIEAIISILYKLDWSPLKIRRELDNVLINSSSKINYARDPKRAAEELVDSIRIKIDKYHLTINGD